MVLVFVLVRWFLWSRIQKLLIIWLNREVLEARHPDYTPNKLFKENCEDVHCKENTRVKSLNLPAANTEFIKQNVISKLNFEGYEEFNIQYLMWGNITENRTTRHWKVLQFFFIYIILSELRLLLQYDEWTSVEGGFILSFFYSFDADFLISLCVQVLW